jgi:hypothetical protein
MYYSINIFYIKLVKDVFCKNTNDIYLEMKKVCLSLVYDYYYSLRSFFTRRRLAQICAAEGRM